MTIGRISEFWQEVASGDREIPRLVSDFWLAAAAGAELPKPPPALSQGAEWREPFLRALASGRSQKDAAGLVGVSIRTVHSYKRTHPEFRAAVATASQAERVDPAARELAAALAGEIARRG